MKSRLPICLAALALTLGACGINPPPSSKAVPQVPVHINRAYVADRNRALIPIDLNTNTAGAPIPLAIVGGGSGEISVAPGEKTAYATTNQGVTPIDLASSTPGTPVAFPAGSQPIAIAIAPDGKFAYVASLFIGTAVSTDSLGNVTPIDLATNRRLTPFPLPAGTAPTAIAITPDGKTAYVAGANYFGSLSTLVPIDLASNAPGPPIPLLPNMAPVGLAIAHDGRTAYVAVNCGGCVNVVIPINLTTNSAGTPIWFGLADDHFNNIVIAADDKTAYVTVSSAGGGYVASIDLTTNRPIDRFPTGAYPVAIAIARDGKTAYLVNSRTANGFTTMADAVNGVVQLDFATKTLGAPIVAGVFPVAIVITP